MSTQSRDQLSKTMRIEIKPNTRANWKPKIRPSASTPHARKKIVVHSTRSRHRDEGKLRAINRGRSELQELFQNTYDAAFITDFTGLISSANVRAAEFFGFSREEMTGASINQLVVGFSEQLLETIAENLNLGRFTLLEADCVRADSSRFQAEISTSLLQLTESDCLCFFLRDITARRAAELSLQAANENLRVEIEERQNAEERLQAAITKLKAHDKAQTQFVSNVSHELKTPLASINYMTGNMLAGVLGPTPERFVPYLNMIREDCTRLRRTVEDILDMSRSEAGSLVLRRVSVAFSRFISQAITPLSIQAETAHLELLLTLDNDLGFVQCDPRKLERVLTNIVKNAIKFNRDGGSIHVKAWRETHDGQHWVCVCVDDTGIGIDAEHLPRITERFYRVGEYVSGSGLGLYISKELVERHEGSLDIQSPPPGQSTGTRVLIRLPSIAAPTVLLIHSCETVRDVVARTMMNMGYALQAVAEGAGANAILDTVEPDYIILDWSANDMSGAAMIAATNSHPALSDVPFLVITGEEESPAKKEILRGFNLPTVSGSLTEDNLLNSFDKILADHDG